MRALAGLAVGYRTRCKCLFICNSTNRVIIAFALAVMARVSVSEELPAIALSPQGLGGVRVGMHLNAVARAMGNSDLYERSGRMGTAHCYSIQSKLLDAMQGITFVGVDTPAVRRVEVREPDMELVSESLAKRVRTSEGVKLGDPEVRIDEVYSKVAKFLPPARLSSSYYLVELRGKPYGYAFVVDDGVVVEMRSGQVTSLKVRESCE